MAGWQTLVSWRVGALGHGVSTTSQDRTRPEEAPTVSLSLYFCPPARAHPAPQAGIHAYWATYAHKAEAEAGLRGLAGGPDLGFGFP